MNKKQAIIHLDIARKYFSPAALCSFVNMLAENGISHLELYFSDNQGFRLALDDMLFTVNGKQYDLSCALGDGVTDAASGMTPDGSGQFLTQEEMRVLIRYAADRGVEIVPAFDMPGHMGAILQRFPDFCYSVEGERSFTSLDIFNDEAVALSLALLERYARFFAAEGCRSFNVICDEFALELGGFARIAAAGHFPQFLKFAEAALKRIEGCALAPRVFNDAVCYEEDGPFVSMPEIEVCCCIPSQGTAAQIARQHRVINGSTELFWVMGRPDWQTNPEKIESFCADCFSDGSIADATGVMLCFWCDIATAQTQEEFLAAAEPLIRAFGRRFGSVSER